MKRYLDMLQALTVRQQITGAVGLAIIALIMTTMIRMATTPTMALLYAGLDPTAAGEVVTALDQEGVPFEVRGNSIYVPQHSRDQLRMVLAGQSLPTPSTEGYELLDRLDGFSTTSEMFSVTYWRAKEGELSRTLMTIPGIRAARVHIGTGQRTAFVRSDEKRTASVTVTAPAGLDASQVKAVRFLTALAVPNLNSEDVAVIDTARGLLTAEAGAMGAPSIDENARAQSLEADILRLVEARVGMGNARVNVSMELGRRHEEIAERAVDPASQVVMSRMTEADQSTERGSNRAVTVASDLPDGEAEGADESSESSMTREEVNFAVTTTDRRIELLPGSVERMSIAVLLDQKLDEEGLPVERSPEEIDDLRLLVEAAAGVNPARGDIVTIRSMPFDRTFAELPQESAGMLGDIPLMRFAELGVLAVTLLLFGLMVVKPVLSPSRGGAADDAAALMIADGSEAAMELAAQDPVAMLRDASAERPDAAATLLNAWLEEEAA
ncbi:MAG: flagellar basal-body MS-ring/collar protein FliF [Pseudomonadota bacterium]